MIRHPFPPLYDKDSTVLILGSFPSVKSREQMFFYWHPQNRFWRVTAAVFGVETPVTIEEKKAFLHENHIALWDVIASCEIQGSADSTIGKVTVNDLRPILEGAKIRTVFVNGKTAEKYYNCYTVRHSNTVVFGYLTVYQRENREKCDRTSLYLARQCRMVACAAH